MRFRTQVDPPEPMRGLAAPEAVIGAVGGGNRPAVVITINGHSWKSRVAIMRRRSRLGLSTANRRAAGVDLGDEIDVDLELDSEPRVIIEPVDFARASATTRPAARPPGGRRSSLVAFVDRAPR